mmetsp:Transcript_25402/g.35618  ORF Transcript_25402/g.35618 Transcript_25402/m.35618 type:complete len:635 (+) Transcript_25402:38-1942(+)
MADRSSVVLTRGRSTSVLGRELASKCIATNITLSNLSVSIPAPRNLISKLKREPPQLIKVLENVDGVTVHAGQLLAVLGTSGSGKTTLLNAIAGRLDDNTILEGQIKFNSMPTSVQQRRNRVGYVLQTDRLLPNLTVKETLQYATYLRLPSSYNKEKKEKLVEDVIDELGLRDCSDTFIGGNGRRGISGGERRRVSIGVQLLTNPSVILLDEPTSGLDSFTAQYIMKTLLSLTKDGRTVICTVHQPRSDIFQLFPQVMFLSKGQLAYYGESARVIEYFAELGCECPETANPCDFILDVIAIDYRDPYVEEQSKQRLTVFAEHYVEYSKSAPYKYDLASFGRATQPTFDATDGTPFFHQALTLLRRQVKNNSRDRQLFISRILEAIFLGLLVGFIFYSLGNSEDDIRSRLALCSAVAQLQPYITQIATLMYYAKEMLVYDRERFDRMYLPLPYWLAIRMSMLPLAIVTPILFSTIVYWLTGLRESWTHFLWFVLIQATTQYAVETLGFASSCLIRNFAAASLLCNSLLPFWTYSAGFFVNPDTYPPYMTYIQYTSPTQYGFSALAANELKGNEYDCPYQNSTDAYCQLYDGDYILDSMNLPFSNIGINLGALFAIIMTLNVLSFLCLKFVPHKPL